MDVGQENVKKHLEGWLWVVGGVPLPSASVRFVLLPYNVCQSKAKAVTFLDGTCS